MQRAERAGCKQRITRPPQHTYRTLPLAREPFNQCCFANTGLAAHQGHPALTVDRVSQRHAEFVQMGITFEE